MFQKIIIFGHAGRGKTTFAEQLSKKLSIPCYSTDDFFYKKKFKEINDKEQSVIEINKVYDTDKWIMEGTTGRLIRPGIEKADIVFALEFRSILFQYFFIIKRHFSRKNESFGDLLSLLKHITKKRYKIKYEGNSLTVKEIRENYNKKVIKLNSMKEIQDYINSIN